MRLKQGSGEWSTITRVEVRALRAMLEQLSDSDILEFSTLDTVRVYHAPISWEGLPFAWLVLDGPALAVAEAQPRQKPVPPPVDPGLIGNASWSDAPLKKR